MAKVVTESLSQRLPLWMSGSALYADLLLRSQAMAPFSGTTGVEARIAEILQEQAPARALVDDGVDFDAYLDAQDGQAQQALAEARPWVAQALYGQEVNLATLRLSAKLSQKALGQRCGLLQSHIARYENGDVEPKIGTAAKLAAALGVNLDEFARAQAASAKAKPTTK